MTTEIAAEPNPGGAPERPFRWRVSIADVQADGPFSAFPSYDRTILLLEGKCMRLEAGPHGDIDLARLEPRAFPGEWAVNGRLLDGPVKDFNLMVDRTLAEGSIEVLRTSRREIEIPAEEAETLVLHVLQGSIACGTAAFEASDTLVLDTDASDKPLRLTAGAGTVLILARIRPASIRSDAEAARDA